MLQMIETMIFLLTPIAVVMLIQSTSATRFYTRYNELCLSECSKKSSYYWCYTGKNSWDYCSPRPNFDINNRLCQNRCERRNGTSYTWCKVNSIVNNISWNYCGKHSNNFNNIATNGYFCTDECAKKGKSFYWCNTDRGWQYCSPNERVDCYGRPCADHSYCDNRGGGYYRCLLNGTGKGWGYCSISGESKHMTHTGFYCSTDCLYDSSADYFRCKKFDGSSEFCSPTTDIQTDSRGHLCHTDCSKYNGSGYYSCYSDIRKWDYCALKALDDGCQDYKYVLKLPSRIKRGNVGTSCLRTVVDEGNNVITAWYMEHDANIKYERDREIDTNAQVVIGRLKIEHLGGNPLTIVTVDKVRLDSKGYTEEEEFAILELHINRDGYHKYLATTLIGTALIQMDGGIPPFPIKYIRNCLNLSLSADSKKCRLVQRVRSGFTLE